MQDKAENETPTAPPALRRPDVPIFVLGLDNEGGDGLADRLGRHPHLARVPRTTLLHDLELLLDQNQAALVHYGMPEQYWRRALGGFLGGLQHAHAARMDKARWVEFLPSSSITIGQINRLFPVAQFVHVVARPRAGAGRRLSVNKREGAALFAGRYLEIGAQDLEEHLEDAMPRVLAFLGELSTVSPGTEVAVEEPELVIDLDRPAAWPPVSMRAG